MKITLAIAFLVYFTSYSQMDTVVLNIENSSLSLKQIKCIFFVKGQCSYSLSDMNSIDNEFYNNSDTIYIQIKKKSKLLIEGKKMPKDHAIGSVFHYRKNKGRIAKIDDWKIGFELKSDSINVWTGESGFISTTTKYRRNISIKKIERQLDIKSNGKVCLKKMVYKRDRNNFNWILKKTTYSNCF